MQGGHAIRQQAGNHRHRDPEQDERRAPGTPRAGVGMMVECIGHSRARLQKRHQPHIEMSRPTGMRLPDLSLAFRNIFRRPGFAIVAITLLALGAGANAAVFSVVRGVLLKPLAFPEPDRLVAVGPQFFISNEEMDYWRTRTRSFEHIAAISPGWMMGLVAEGGEPIKVTGGRVSDNMFQALGARAALGRTIEPGDAKPGAPRSLCSPHGLWRSALQRDPRVIGQRRSTRRAAVHHRRRDAARIRDLRARHTTSGRRCRGIPPTGITRPPSRSALARLTRGVTPEIATRELVDLTPAMRKDLAQGERLGTDAARAVAAGVHHRRRPARAADPARRRRPDPDARGRESRHARTRPIDRARRRDGAAHRAGRVTRRLVRQIVIEQAVLATAGAIAGIARRLPGDADPHRAHSRRSATAQRDRTRLDGADDRAGRLGERRDDRGAPTGGDHGAPEPAAAPAPVADHGHARRAAARSACSWPSRLASPWCSASARC